MNITDILSRFNGLPDVWGEGAIFGFSGLDGETQTESRFVASYGGLPFDLLIHTPVRRIVEMRVAEPGEVQVALNDLLVVATVTGDLVVTWSAWHTLVGQLPDGVLPVLWTETGASARPEGEWQISADEENGDVLVLGVHGDRFCLSYGAALEEAHARAHAGLDCDLEQVVRDRLAFFQTVPSLPDPALDQLMKKCAAVMKVNSLSSEGVIQQFWSTPDRIPHQYMWLWDSVFHSLSMNRINPRLAWDFLKSVLDFQRPDGMIPHMMKVDGGSSDITQPPLLAWGVWENYQVLRDRETLTYALPRLERYLTWNLQHRDENGNGLLEWFIEGDVRCRSGESGMDNSPRFDEAVLLDAVDFSTFAALDMAYTARIARELGISSVEQDWQAASAILSAQIHALLWDEAEGFYFDRRMDGSLTGVRAASGFLPLLLPDLPPERARRLVESLYDPRQFNTPFPVPSLAVDHPEWSTDMWRGATWLNFNDFIIRGLAQAGYPDEAARLAKQTLVMVNHYYHQYGVLFEFFDAKDERPPVACDRKGERLEPYNIRRKYDSIRDYHWTAAITARLLLDYAAA